MTGIIEKEATAEWINSKVVSGCTAITADLAYCIKKTEPELERVAVHQFLNKNKALATIDPDNLMAQLLSDLDLSKRSLQALVVTRNLIQNRLALIASNFGLLDFIRRYYGEIKNDSDLAELMEHLRMYEKGGVLESVKKHFENIICNLNRIIEIKSEKVSILTYLTNTNAVTVRDELEKLKQLNMLFELESEAYLKFKKEIAFPDKILQEYNKALVSFARDLKHKFYGLQLHIAKKWSIDSKDKTRFIKVLIVAKYAIGTGVFIYSLKQNFAILLAGSLFKKIQNMFAKDKTPRLSTTLKHLDTSITSSSPKAIEAALNEMALAVA